jgi:glycosyltransferase involved in cell wall biosynthesis
MHGTDAMLLARSALARRLAAPVLRRAGVITTVSAPLARVIAEVSGRPLSAIHVQPMPVETSGWGWSAGGGGLLVVSRLVAQKRVHLALEAAALLPGDLAVTIVGDGPERQALERLSGTLGLQGRVTFTGALAFPDVLVWLQRADAAIVPAAGEGFGLVAAEALMAGVPVVACRDGGGLLDVVPEQGGGRIAGPEGSAIAAATRELLVDPGSRASARADGMRWRAALSPDAVASRFRGWYREAALA